MSFYGNIFYELTNAFSAFIIKNSGNKLSNFITVNENPSEVSAIGIDGKIHLDTGNKWINLDGDFQNHTCSIYHSARDINDLTNSIEMSIINDEIDKEVINLQSGDCLEIAKCYYDNAGHITNIHPQYFKLPTNKTEEDITNLQVQIEDLIKAENQQNTNITALQTDVASANSAINVTNSNVANLSSLVGKRVDFTFAQPSLTISKAIGNVDILAPLGCDSVANGVYTLYQGLDGVQSSISNNDLATKVAIKNLCEKLNEQGINIDYDSLWSTT